MLVLRSDARECAAGNGCAGRNLAATRACQLAGKAAFAGFFARKVGRHAVCSAPKEALVSSQGLPPLSNNNRRFAAGWW